MKYSNEQIAEAVKASDSWAGVYRILSNNNVKPKSAAGMQALFKKRAAKAGIDSSHFKFKRKGEPVGTKLVEVAVAVDPATTPPPVAA